LAVRKIVYLGSIALTVYQLPDGDYTLSANGITGAVKERRSHMLDFFASKSLQDLSCKGWNMLGKKAKKPVSGVGMGNNIARCQWGMVRLSAGSLEPSKNLSRICYAFSHQNRYKPCPARAAICYEKTQKTPFQALGWATISPGAGGGW